MNAGHWTLRPGAVFGVKEYDRRKNLYVLFDRTEGPCYLIDHRIIEILKDLHEPHTTQQIRDKLEKMGISGNETGSVLCLLEKADVIVYSNDTAASAGALRVHGSMEGIVSENMFRSITLAAVGLLSLILVHYVYLLVTRFSLLLSVRRAPTIDDYLFFFALVVAFALLHEAAHCCVHYLACGSLPKKISLKPMGAMFLIPAPKVNLNVTYLLDSRLRRIAVLGAGLGMDLVLIWGSFLMVIITRQAPLWVYLSWFCSVSLVFNLVPLWKSDGYYLLSETVRMPDLSMQAAAALKRMLARKDGYSRPLAIYGALRIVFETSILTALLIIWYRLASLMGIMGKYFFWSVFACVFFAKFVQGYKKHKRRRH